MSALKILCLIKKKEHNPKTKNSIASKTYKSH